MPPETVIAEKFQAMVMLGRATNRMKDLYDGWALSRKFEFKGDKLARAINATFARRKAEIPSELPDALTTVFAEDPTKIQQWSSFVEDVALQPGTLSDVVQDLGAFLTPRASAARPIPNHSIGSDRAGDVFEVLLAQIGELNPDLASDMN